MIGVVIVLACVAVAALQLARVRPQKPDQWRRYRGVAKLRPPRSDMIDLSNLRKRL